MIPSMVLLFVWRDIKILHQIALNVFLKKAAVSHKYACGIKL